MIFRGKIKNWIDWEKLSNILTPFLQPNFYLILQGELGAGKTTLVQVIAKKIGITSKVTSPTFNILQQYPVEETNQIKFYLNHFDFFRLKVTDNLDFFLELTLDNLNIVEWGEKNPHFWQEKKYLHINLIKERNSETRIIIMTIPFSLSSVQEKKFRNFFC